jgi:preprotein translocase subunit SecF
MKIIKHSKIFFTLSGALFLASVASIAFFGLKPGIDFTGGSLMEVQFKGMKEPLTAAQIRTALTDIKLESLAIQPTDNNSYLLRFGVVPEETHQMIIRDLEKLAVENNKETAGAESYKAEELRYDSIGPVIGKELKEKSVIAFIIVIIAIIIYIAWAFRKVAKPVPSWQYGIIAVIALVHDVGITLGIFSALGHFLNVELDIGFVAAILTVLGYSVNDTIVVFDRVRENLVHRGYHGFEETVNQSISQTMTRSLNTGLATLFVLISVYAFGGVTIRYFMLALIVGIIIGTYSSIFLASPLLVAFNKEKIK